MIEIILSFCELVGHCFVAIFSVLLNPLVFIPVLVYALVCIYNVKKYEKTTYFKVTNKDYFTVRRNLGFYGEYLIYDYLKEYEKIGAKFLFNIYIPKENGETTEIDVLMITPKGLFVFESKNYSGWIFGSETQRNWYQTLPVGRGGSHKEVFYNPVMQNKTHIKFLKSVIGEDIFTYSIISFSDRCELKKLHIKSDNLTIVNRYKIKRIIPYIYEKLETVLTDDQVNVLYNKLYPYTQVTEETKQKHIEVVHNKLDNNEKIDSFVNNIQCGEGRCPKCGGQLLKRSGRYGVFWGCTNYPRCRFTTK